MLLMIIRRFEDLEIWQIARELNKEIIRITSTGPFSKDYSFKGQICASSGSIPDNIAEGFDRGGNKEFLYFLSISKGSCGELLQCGWLPLYLEGLDAPSRHSRTIDS